MNYTYAAKPISASTFADMVDQPGWTDKRRALLREWRRKCEAELLEEDFRKNSNPAPPNPAIDAWNIPLLYFYKRPEVLFPKFTGA